MRHSETYLIVREITRAVFWTAVSLLAVAVLYLAILGVCAVGMG